MDNNILAAIHGKFAFNFEKQRIKMVSNLFLIILTAAELSELICSCTHLLKVKSAHYLTLPDKAQVLVRSNEQHVQNTANAQDRPDIEV